MQAYVHSPAGHGQVAPLAHAVEGLVPRPPLPLAEVRRLLTAAAAVLVIAEEDGLGCAQLTLDQVRVQGDGEVVVMGLERGRGSRPAVLGSLGRSLLDGPLPRAWEALDDPLLCADLLGAWTLLRHADVAPHERDSTTPTLPTPRPATSGTPTITWEGPRSVPTLALHLPEEPTHAPPVGRLTQAWLAAAIAACLSGSLALGAAAAYTHAAGGGW